MKKRVSLILAILMVVSVLFSACSSKQATTGNAGDNSSKAAPVEKITIRIGHSASETNIYQITAEAFKAKAEELLGKDRVDIQIFPNASLGSQTEMIEAMQMGTLDGVVFGRHSQIDSRLDVLNLPFLFEDTEHMTKVLRGEEGAAIREQITKMFEAKGIVMLGMFEAGFRNITSSKKISSMDDLKGMVIRTPNTDVLMDSFKAWGANPTPLDIGELYTALQTKVADGQENPYQLIYTNKYYEVNPFICVTNHSTICDEMQFSKIVWDKYPQDVQEKLREAAKYACDVAGETNNKKNAELLSELSKLTTVTEMPKEDVAKMKQIAIEKVYPKFLVDDVSGQIVKDIQAIGSK